ncbi:MAG: hypothetical protein LBU30_02120 [Candidatus Methanoplasma sp.]|jgi:hypothetical protein|nr:hypothetical protein [Candidatus Methanoplasma sp.]
MGLFGDGMQVFRMDNLKVGEFDPGAEGFYRNVMTFSFNVKKKRILRAVVRSDNPVDIAVADEKGSSVAHKQAILNGELADIPTGDSKEMGLFIGVYPGDTAVVSVEIWMERP